MVRKEGQRERDGAGDEDGLVERPYSGLRARASPSASALPFGTITTAGESSVPPSKRNQGHGEVADAQGLGSAGGD